jgi:PhnB protein
MTTTTITPYLFFCGRCDEAIAFYQKELGAQVEMTMRYNESPDPAPPGMLPPGFENKVMHASLRIGGALLMLSDGNEDKSLFSGFQLSLAVPTEVEAHRSFDALAAGGEVVMPLTKTFWSSCFGMVTDRFGVTWMVTVPA